MVIKYSYRDLSRHKCHFFLAFCSVFTVVLSSLVISSIISKGPVIFLKMADMHNGEIDAFVTPAKYHNVAPSENAQNQFINYT